VTDVRTLEEQFDRLATDLATLLTLVTSYSAWTRIVSSRQVLSEQIVQLGRDGSDMAGRLERLDSEIAAGFPRDWQAVLSQGDTYERRLKSLGEAVDEIEKQASREFQRLQDGFLTQLCSARCPEENLWSPIVFSQAEVQRVHEQLWGYAGRATVATLDYVEDVIQHLCSELRQKLASPDRERIADRANILLSELKALTAHLPYSPANDPQTVREYDGTPTSVFSELIDDVQKVWEAIGAYQERVAALSIDTPEFQLAPLEMEIISHLNSDALTDLGIVWGYLESSSADAVWSALRTLWERGALQVGIRRMLRQQTPDAGDRLSKGI
jgi:hypothetical protein